MFRLLITDPRTWTDKNALYAALTGVVDTTRLLGEEVVMVNGMCEEGADWMAFKWAKRIARIPVEEHPADWKSWRSMAGYYRNQEMVDLGADLCVACLMPCTRVDCRKSGEHWTHGTNHCMTPAEKAGIPVLKVYPG
jgi:hypothetical protein